MTDDSRAVIRSSAVRKVDAPVLLEPGNPDHAHRDSMTVTPLLEGDVIAGFEVRCGCGAAIVVECVYQEEPS